MRRGACAIAMRATRPAAAALVALLAVACDKGGSGAAPAPAAAATAASAASVPTLSATPAGHPAAALVGTWRQLCQPFLPGDGASDITYTITLKGADALQLAGVAKDYKNITCAGAGSVIATPLFTQKVAGSTTLDGLPALRLVDEGAAAPMPADAKSVVALDQGRLRFGAAGGKRDSDGFPATFEQPADAYTRQ